MGGQIDEIDKAKRALEEIPSISRSCNANRVLGLVYERQGEFQ
jgi:hypothetical protein